MKIQLYSDIHLEFDKNFTIPKLDSDVIILAGDIGVGVPALYWAIEQGDFQKKPILYVYGNHEYYYNSLHFIEEMKNITYRTSEYVRILDNESIQIDNTIFIGTTLWTDYELHGVENKSYAMDYAKHNMSDYKVIYGEFGLFSPKESIDYNFYAKQFLEDEISYAELSNKEKIIVITHMAPSAWGIGIKYHGDIMSPAFASDLEPFIQQHPKINLWISGHTHFNYDRICGNTRLISNQKGYPKEGVTGFNRNLIVEI